MDETAQRAQMELVLRRLPRAYFAAAVVAVGAVVLVTVGRDVRDGLVMLGIDAATLVALLVVKRSFERELNR